jgi:hypothetical protein
VAVDDAAAEAGADRVELVEAVVPGPPQDVRRDGALGIIGFGLRVSRAAEVVDGIYAAAR